MLNSEASRSDSVTGRWHGTSGPVSRGKVRTWVRQRQAVLLLAGACLIIATGTILVHSSPDWLSWDRVLRAGWPDANFVARAWRLILTTGSLLLSILALAILLLFIVISNEVARHVVASFTQVAGDSRAPVHMGFCKRSASGLAGSTANLGLALLIAWIIAGLQGAVLGLHVMKAGFLTFGHVILSPFAFGTLADFVAGPLQETLAAAQSDGLGWLGTWWVLLSTLFAVANLLNLHR